MALCTPAQRQETLDRLIAALREDSRLMGVALVGSTAVGFNDEYSDLDVAAVLMPDEDLESVWSSWRPRCELLLPVRACCEIRRSPGTHLYEILLADFLALDLGFNTLPALQAPRPQWRVVFDRSALCDGQGLIGRRLTQSWAERPQPALADLFADRLDHLWPHVQRAAVSLPRAQPWAALQAIEAIRHSALDLACWRFGLESREGRTAHELPSDVQAALAASLPASLEPPALLDALRGALACFFSQAEALDEALRTGRATSLRVLMTCYLEHFR